MARPPPAPIDRALHSTSHMFPVETFSQNTASAGRLEQEIQEIAIHTAATLVCFLIAQRLASALSFSGFDCCTCCVQQKTAWIQFFVAKENLKNHKFGDCRRATRKVDIRSLTRQIRVILKKLVIGVNQVKVHIVLAHPEEKSFNAQLSSTTQRVLGVAGNQITNSDLYAMDFDPREGPHHYNARKDAAVFHAQTEQRFNADNDTTPAEVNSEAQCLLDCDLLVVHFPLWWFGMPAILKGWMDRVFVYGKMYRSAMRYDAGICAGKRMIACVTTGASEDSCSYNGREGDTQLHLWPILFAFRYLGFDVLEPEIFHGVGGVAFVEGHEDGVSALDTYSNRWSETLEALASRPSVQYNHDTDYDETKRLVPGAPVYSPFIRQNPDAISQ